MSAYFILNYSVTDAQNYRAYRQQVGNLLAEAGAKVIAASDNYIVLEGQPEEHIIVVEFESQETLQRFYESEIYQAILPIRLETTHGWAVNVQGFQSG